MDNSILGLIIFGIIILLIVGFAFLNPGSRSRNTTPRVVVIAPPVTPPAAPPAIPMSLRNVNNMTNSGVDMDDALANGCEFTEEVTPWSYVRRIKQPKYHAPVVNVFDNRVNYNQAANANQHQPNQGGGGNQHQPNQGNGQQGQGQQNRNQPNQGGGGNQNQNQGQQGQGQQNRNPNPPNNGGNGGNQNQPNNGGGGNQGGNQGNRRGGQQGQGGNGP